MRKLAALCLFLLVALGLALTPKPGAAAEKMVWKFGTFFDFDHALTKGAVKFKEEVEKKHGDKVEIKIYPINQLGDGREYIEGLQSGTIELAEAGLPWTTSFSDAYGVLSMYYLFLNRDIAYRVLDGELGTKMKDRFEKQAGIKLLGYWENGIRHATNSKRPINKPEDFSGLKIRVQQDPVHLIFFRALGANPTPMSFGEVFTALQQNVIDGQENPYANIVQRKFYEVQKYMSTTAHVYDVTGFYMNMELFDSLDAQFQKDILEAAKVATAHQRKEAVEQDARYLKTIQDYGKMEMTYLSPEQLVAFKKAVEPAYKEVEAMLAKKDKAWSGIVNELLQNIAAIEAELLKK